MPYFPPLVVEGGGGGGGETPPAPFVPTDLTGLVLWLDASDDPTFVQSAGKVSAWTNRANPALTLVQGTPAIQPAVATNAAGRCARFLDSQAMTVADATCNLANMTVICVMLGVAPGAGGGTVVGCADPGAGKGWWIAGYSDTDQIEWTGISGYSTASLNVPTDVPTIQAFRQTVPTLPIGNLDGGSDDISASAGGNYVSPTTPTQTFVGDGAGWGVSFTGDINEVLVYDSALSLSDLRKVEGYVAWKWNLQALLPVDHPYKDAAPTTGGAASGPTGPAGGDLTGTYPDPTLAAGAVDTVQIVDNSITNAKLAAGPTGTMKGRRVSPTGDSQGIVDLDPYSIQAIISKFDVTFGRRLTVLDPEATIPVSIQAMTASGETALLELFRNITPVGGSQTVGSIAFWGQNDAGAKLYAGQVYSQLDVTAPASPRSSLWLNTLVPVVGGQTQMRMSTGVVLGNPTGDYKGVGSLNAENGFYDNGVRLTAGSAAVLSFRNALGRNGGMEVWQRGDGGTAVFAVAQNSSPAYVADGWYLYTSANQAFTVWQSPGLPGGSAFCMRVQRNSGQTGLASVKANCPLDTDELAPLRGNIVTVSFIARAGATFNGTGGALAVVLYTGTSVPGRRGQSAYSGEVAVISSSTPITTTATRYTFTSAVVVPANATCLEVGIGPAGYIGAAGANDYFEIDDVQLEVGTAATPFERRFFDMELAASKRYYQKTFDYNTVPSQGGGSFGAWSASQSVPASTVMYMCCPLLVEMRSNFSVTLFNTVAASTQVQNATAAAPCTLTSATVSGRKMVNIVTTTPAGSAIGQLLQIHATCNSSL